MQHFYLRIIKFEECLDVADEVGVGADQRLNDGHPRPGLLTSLRVRSPAPPVQPPLAEIDEEVTCYSWLSFGKRGEDIRGLMNYHQ